MGFFINGGGYVFCLIVVVGFLLMVMAKFFVYCDGWVFFLWQWLSFYVGGYVYCLMVVVRFLFMIVAEFLC